MNVSGFSIFNFTFEMRTKSSESETAVFAETVLTSASLGKGRGLGGKLKQYLLGD